MLNFIREKLGNIYTSVLAALWRPTVGNLNTKPHAVKTTLLLGQQTFIFWSLLRRKTFKTI